MNAKKRFLFNFILVVICTLINVLLYSALVRVDRAVFLSQVFSMIPIATILAALIGSDLAAVLVAAFSGIAAYYIDTATLRPGNRFIYLCFGLAVALICSRMKKNGMLRKVVPNSLLAIIISALSILMYGLADKTYSGYWFKGTQGIWIRIVVSVIIPFVVVFVCFFVTQKYRASFLNAFSDKGSELKNSYRKNSVSAKVTVAIVSVVVLVMVTVVTSSSITYFNQIKESSESYLWNIAYSADMDSSFERTWKEDEQKALERLGDSLAKLVPADNNIYDVKGFCVYLDCSAEQGKAYKIAEYTFDKRWDVDTSHYILNVSYERMDESVDIGELLGYDSVDSSELIGTTYWVGDKIWFAAQMSSTAMKLVPAYVYQQVILGAIVAMLIGYFAVWWLERQIVLPMNRMAATANRFVKVNEEGRERAKEQFAALSIHTGDEVENLYESFTTAMNDMTEYVENIKIQTEHITQIQHNVITTMADIVESRDENTGGHIRRTAKYVEIIANELVQEGKYLDILTPQYISDMVVAAPLHDMGKIHVSDQILNKKGRLTDEEYDVMKTHAAAGRELLEKATENLGNFEYLDMAIDMAGMHHEWWNGKGYPNGLAGQDIPLCARIMAVADVFDAIFSKRCYKEAMEFEEAFEIVIGESGEHFDPQIIEAFVAAKEKIRQAATE